MLNSSRTSLKNSKDLFDSAGAALTSAMPLVAYLNLRKNQNAALHWYL